MFKKIACVIVMLVGSTAVAGIIGVGGTNANQHPDVLEALRKSERVTVDESEFRRLSARLSVSNSVNAEVTYMSGQKIRRDFIKVFADSEGEVVDKEIRIKLEPKDGW